MNHSPKKPAFVRLFRRLWAILKFIPFYIWEMIISSLALAYDILRPKKSFHHGIVAVEIDIHSETALLALINLASMTPGSLVVAISSDRKTLYIHTMYLENPKAFKAEFKKNFENRIKEIFE
jgi:multicomponent Na+:H+ antiporter subunit E